MKKLSAFILSIGLFFTAFSNTFNVTSNADSGPGTLREAIINSNANGTTITDYIYFNLPSTTEAGRTISLLTSLPALSSNIVIDASTQPGMPFGISSARVILYLDHLTPPPFNFLLIENAFDVSIYGLCFKYFGNPYAGSGMHYGIRLQNSSRITIGAPGKGNLFAAIHMAIIKEQKSTDTVTNRQIIIQSNVFGLFDSPTNGGSVQIWNAAEIIVGGPNVNEGNIFVGAHLTLYEDENTTSAFFAKVQNNKFNFNWDGDRYYGESGFISLNGNSTLDTSIVKTWVLNNIMASGWPAGIALANINHAAIVQGNKVGTDFTGTICKGGVSNDLSFYECKKVIVGGYGPGEENTIAGTLYTQKNGVNIIRGQFGWISTNGHSGEGYPFIKIISYDNGLITGKANPDSKIQLYTNTCNSGCIKRFYLTSVNADASGDWSFSYTQDMPNIVATATTKDSSTSPFSEPRVEVYPHVVITNETCGKINGSITGIKVFEGTHIRWMNGRTGEIISTDTNLVNVPAGSYVLLVSNGIDGCIWSTNIEVNGITLPEDIQVTISNASCGGNNGYLMLDNRYNLAYKWFNNQGDSVGAGYYANNLSPGIYYLKMFVSSDTSCNKTFGPYNVQNISGPTINSDNVQIKPAYCRNKNGSITGINVTNTSGVPFIQWLDSLNRVVGTSMDLQNVGSGNYRLKYKDESACDTIITSSFYVSNHGSIAIDTSETIVTSSKCSANTGSIINMKVTGAEDYKWFDISNNKTIGNSTDIFNLSPGSYQLEVSNSMNCSEKSPVFEIQQETFKEISVSNIIVQNAVCAQPNGSINIIDFNRSPDGYTFHWEDSISRAIVGSGIAINNLPGGRYQLFAKDGNGCEKQILSLEIKTFPIPEINYKEVKIIHDKCGLHSGKILDLKIDGLSGPTEYLWYDQNGNIAGKNPDLVNATAGTYTLHISDAGKCNIISNPITIANNDISLSPPVYEDIVIQRFENADIKVNDLTLGVYRLYQDSFGEKLIQENRSGRFLIPQLSTDTVFYIRLVSGNCESPLRKVHIKVVDHFFALPNAFTPNGDGLNDIFKVIYPIPFNQFHFVIYSRFGEKIFETTNIKEGWDGRFKGELLPIGNYVWTIRILKGNEVLVKKGTVNLVR